MLRDNKQPFYCCDATSASENRDLSVMCGRVTEALIFTDILQVHAFQNVITHAELKPWEYSKFL